MTSTFRVVSPSVLTHSDSTKTRVYFKKGKVKEARKRRVDLVNNKAKG